MKKHLFFLLILPLLIPVTLQAQQVWGGGFGKGTVGYYPLSSNAKLPGNLSLGNQTPYWGIGGAGFGRVGKKILIGGGGFGVVQRELTNTTNGLTVRSDWGMGFFDLGWVLQQRKKRFIYAFAGVGAGGIELDYSNTGSSDIDLGEQLRIRPNENIQIESGGFAWEAGISLNRLLYNPEGGQSGGFNIGIDLGLSMLPRMSKWETSGAGSVKFSGLSNPYATAFYIRFVLGGGMF